MLGAPLGVLAVRKLGVPGHSELAFGAVASGGIRVLDDEMLQRLPQLDAATVEYVTAREQDELERRDAAYCSVRPRLDLGGHTVILVDDGIATGSTMWAAAAAVRSRAAQVLVASPVASARAVHLLGDVADEVIVAFMPEQFSSVGAHYRDFSQLTDAEVVALLAGSP